ncbi:M42 family metallopeptidase [Natronomonas salina]|uniref:M42 family metallopeptidase n=1 Tax=Natronomonas salina TaxID=1710540 RepID=UPI0015B39CB0|nr:M42 family metallopeptidase [Natronomonas salina]QLD88506.1 M42 family metallopeptidase [Natronomonas salina]
MPPFDHDLLVSLTEARGVPGYEDRVRELVREELEPHVDRVRSDAMGNLVGTIEGSETPDFEVAVPAHMDEIGFMVRNVTDEGFLELDALGGWDPRILRAQRVTVHTDDGDVPGLIGSVPPHTLSEEEREKQQQVEDVHVDLGLDGEDAAERVAVGDLVTMDQTTERVGEFVTGKSLDNRVSVFAMLEAARRLEDPAATVHLAATTQEEVGLRGAEALGVDLDPDLVLALDTTVANDVPGFDAGERVTELGEGAGIKLKDSSVITNHKVHRRLRSLAEDREIAHQLEVLPAGGTDTGGLQRTSGATPAGAISVPTRYLHTPTESVHEADVAAVIDLLVGFLETEDGEHDYTL